MRIEIISFTPGGVELSLRIREGLGKVHNISCSMKYEKMNHQDGGDDIHPVKESLQQWTGEVFSSTDALIFVGAAGIAVRAISAFVRDKLSDPAVLVCDEAGHFVIPILSGHYGGGNELAEQVAQVLSATPVITTATDVKKCWAVDVFARKNGLRIFNREGIATVSAKSLAGETLRLQSKKSIAGECPVGVSCVGEDFQDPVDVRISIRQKTENAALLLCPPVVWIGMGCKKGKSFEELAAFLEEMRLEENIAREAIAGIASIDVKKEESGLLQLAESWKVDFVTYSPEDLKRQQGDFTKSDFVCEKVGVDNVCERAAMAAAGGGASLILKKRSRDGMTLAMAVSEYPLSFVENK
ncbi:MAG: cobalt-precorrin 5A hydrolase [Roseburia sp.]